MKQAGSSIESLATRRAFSHYLRTGRRLPPSMFEVAAEALETKFNAWHDPDNGRFTFAGAGQQSGGWNGGDFTGGGGGSAGGGGATGHDVWRGSASSSSRHGAAASPARQRAGVAALAKVPTTTVSTRLVRQQDTGAPWQRIVRNGYEYRIDDEQRTRHVSGALTLNRDQARSRASQAAAGGSDRLETDDGGHYIARRFNGPRAAFNHFAQDSNFNRGGYRVLEDTWAKAKRAGESVSVQITPHYGGSSRRPDAIEVLYKIGGDVNRVKFANASKGKAHGKR